MFVYHMKFWIFVFLIFLVSACTQDQMMPVVSMDIELENNIKRESPENSLEFYILPDETDYDNIPQDSIRNPLNAAKVELGKFLFFETGFATAPANDSGFGTYSCATCHVPEAGFKSGFFQGVADGGEAFGLNGEDRRRKRDYEEHELDVQSIRPLSLINVAFVKNTLWNGRFGSEGSNIGTEHLWKESDGTAANALGFESLETQNFEGIETHRIHVTKELIEAYGYTELFDEAFPDLTDEERYSNHGGSLAMSAYLRTVLSNKAPFQDWLKGDKSAMTIEEKQGGILFFGKANCSNCHYNENLGSGEFHALGVKDIDMRAFFKTTDAELEDRNNGRGAFTGNPEDMFRFKVPQVYNTGDAPFYFHGSSIKDLEDVIEYKNLAVTESDRVPQEMLSEKFMPLNLTEEEKQQLLAFLKGALRDPELTRYKPDYLLSGNCFPNNDPISKSDLGCD